MPSDLVRVVHVVDTEGWGGAEAWVAHHVRRAHAHGVRVAVVAAEPVAQRFHRWLPPDRVVPVPVMRFAAVAPEVRAALRRLGPDVVHVNLVDPGSNAAVLEAALDHAPTVATLHLAGDTAVGPGRATLAALYRRLDRLVTPSADTADQVRRELAEPRAGIVVQRNGVDVPPDPRGPAGRPVPRIGVHCRLTEQKGVDVLVEACRLLLARGRAVEVAVAGEGRDGDELRRRGAGLPVTFVGWAGDVRAFLAGLDVFCLPSRREAMPLALLEALAEGLPCVATDVGDVGAVLGDVVDLVPADDPLRLADALDALLQAGDRARDLADRGRAYAVRELDADLMAARTYTHLRAAVGQRTDPNTARSRST